MNIRIVWSTQEAAQSAQRIAGSVSTHVQIPLLAKESGDVLYQGLRNGNILEFPANSLNAQIRRYDGQEHPAYVYAQLIQGHLKHTHNIVSELYIDGMNPIQHAAAEERRADQYKTMIASAIEQLRNTRSWIKHRAIQSIRRHLEQAIGIHN